jgi:uncharacterized membrane protein
MTQMQALSMSPAVEPGTSPVEQAPSGLRWRRGLRRLLDSLWFIPAVSVILALALGTALLRWDEADPVVLARAISAASASAALSALGSGMLAFTGFVTSIVLLIIQFGTSEFSPRFLNWFRSDARLRYALSAFIATFLFALVSTAQMGRGTAAFVPTRTLIAALLLTLLSIAMFLLLINHTSYGLRVAKVLQSLDGDARAVFDIVYPSSAAQAAAAEEAARSLRGRPAVQTLHHSPVGSVLVTLDRPRLVKLAESHDAVIQLVRAVGDHVPGAGALLNVYGSQAIPGKQLRNALAMGDERTLRDDPAFTIRMMVDVAIKALSPAVNDPTTAVQALDRIEDLLRYAAAKHLSVGVVTDGLGVIRLVYPTPTWEDFVELALDEIRAFGAGQYQVARRLRALLDALIADLPEHRRPALEAQSALLADAVEHSYSQTQRADALVPDRQGIGMSRRAGR